MEPEEGGGKGRLMDGAVLKKRKRLEELFSVRTVVKRRGEGSNGNMVYCDQKDQELMFMTLSYVDLDLRRSISFIHDVSRGCLKGDESASELAVSFRTERSLKERSGRSSREISNLRIAGRSKIQYEVQHGIV